MRILAVPFIIIAWILMITSEIGAFAFAFWNAHGFWSFLGYSMIGEIVLRALWLILMLIGTALDGAGRNKY
jgi:hypothetical protein